MAIAAGADADDDEETNSFGTIFLILTVLALVISLLIIICSCIMWTDATLGGALTFAFLGGLTFLVAILQFINRTAMVKNICGQCPPANMS